MDPKTVFVICITLIAIGSIVENLLTIVGLTKTKVDGGTKVGVVYFTAIIANLVGWGIFLILLVTSGSTIANAISCLFGGR